MELINPYYEISNQESFDLIGIYKQIEKTGRVSHKSEDRITETSAKDFLERLIGWGHTACLEQGSVYLKINNNDIEGLTMLDEIPFEKVDHYLILNEDNEENIYVSTNARVIQENNLHGLLKYLCPPTEYHEKRYCVKFVCSRAISHELVRHRKMSFIQESQRYVNYSKNKFNKEIKFIKPLWYDDNKHNIYYESFSEDQWTKEDRFYKACMNSERDYFQLLDYGLKPQEAREVLINSTKTEIYVTGFKSDWDKFFDLRCDIAAHPEMRRLCIPLKEELFNEIR